MLGVRDRILAHLLQTNNGLKYYYNKKETISIILVYFYTLDVFYLKTPKVLYSKRIVILQNILTF